MELLRKDTVVTLSDGYRHYVKDIKKIQKKFIALMYCLEDNIYRFATEEVIDDELKIVFVNDPEKRIKIAKMFDEQNLAKKASK